MQLTNDTDQHMAFKLSSTDSVDWLEQFLPWYGIVAARSTYTLILNVFLERDIAEKRFCDMILESCTCEYSDNNMYSVTTYWENFFDDQMTKKVVNEVKLTAFLSSSQHRQSMVAPKVRKKATLICHLIISSAGYNHCPKFLCICAQLADVLPFRACLLYWYAHVHHF
jgi:hypothetical protein